MQSLTFFSSTCFVFVSLVRQGTQDEESRAFQWTASSPYYTTAWRGAKLAGSWPISIRCGTICSTKTFLLSSAKVSELSFCSSLSKGVVRSKIPGFLNSCLCYLSDALPAAGYDCGTLAGLVIQFCSMTFGVMLWFFFNGCRLLSSLLTAFTACNLAFLKDGRCVSTAADATLRRLFIVSGIGFIKDFFKVTF